MTDEDFDLADRALLAELLAGDRPPHDPAVAERLARNPALAAELARLTALGDALGAVGHERHAALAAARAEVTDADLAIARRAVAAAHTEAKPRRARARFLAAAAIVLVALIGYAVLHGRGQPPDDTILGPGPAEFGMAPHGVVAQGALTAFTWRTPTTPGGAWRITVYPAQDGQPTSFTPVFVVDELEGNAWQPDPTRLAALRELAAFCWDLTALDRDGQALRSARAFVRWSR
jgi:hypothetical protein